MFFSNWNSYNKLKTIATTTSATVRSVPVASSIGLAAGGVWGVSTANEGRGPIGNTLFWAPIGLGLGVAGAKLGPQLKTGFAQGREAWDFLRRAPKSWQGAASSNATIRDWVQQAEAAAVTNPGMRSAAKMYGPLMGTPSEYLARGQKPTSEELLNTIHSFLRDRFQLSGKGQLTPGELSKLSPEVPEWLRTAMGISMDEGLMASPRTGFRTLTGATFNKATQDQLNTWENVFKYIENWGDNPDLRNRFLTTLNSKMRQFASGYEGGLSAADLGLRPARTKALEEIGDMGQISKMLRAQGQTKIARWAEILTAKHGNVEITGIINPNIATDAKNITSLRVMLGDLEEAITLDIPGTGGIIRHGKFGRNIHVPRNILDLRSIGLLYQGSLAKNLRPRRMDPTSFVLKQLSIGYGGEDSGELVSFLRRTYERATAWEPDQYRLDRNAAQEGLAMASVGRGGPLPFYMQARMQSTLVALPVSETGQPISSLMRKFKIPEGPSSPINTIGQMQGLEVPNWLAEWGMYTTASENQARNAVFSNALDLLGFDPNILENPLSKPSILERDVAKPFFIGYNDKLGGAAAERAKKVVWAPFATEKMRANVPIEQQGFLTIEKPLFEAEVAYMRKLVYEGNRRNTYRIFRMAGIDKDKWRLLYSTLARISEINEGVIGAAVPRALENVSIRKVEFDLLNKKLLGQGVGWKSLIGKELSPEDFAGIDLETGEMIGHTFTGRVKGRAIIRELEAVTDPKTNKEKIIALLEERYPGMDTKIGSTHTKSYMKALREDSIPVFSQFTDWLRTRTGHTFKKIYRGNAILPLIGEIPGGMNVVASFGLQSTMGKYQNRMTVLANNLLVKYLPKMTAAARTRVIKQLGDAGIDVAQGPSGFEATMRNVEFGSMAEWEARFEQILGSKRGQGALRNIYTSMYRNPSRFFGRKGANTILGGFTSGVKYDRKTRRLTNRFGTLKRMPGGGNIGFRHIQSLEMMSGAVSSAKMWDTLESNIPTKGSITMHELMYLKQYGMEKVWSEMIGRGKRAGDPDVTGRMFGALSEIQTGGRFKESTIKNLGLGKFSLDDTSAISRVSTNEGFRLLEKTRWRTLGQFENNFVIDLVTAHATMKGSDRAVRDALGGTTRIFVPGTKSDIWGTEFTLPTGRKITTEEFVEPLERLLNQVARYYENPAEKKYLKEASKSYRAYMAAINEMSKSLYTGRGGSVKDAGPWFASRLQYRPYRSIFGKAMGEELAGTVTGISTKKWHKFARSLMREQGVSSIEDLVQLGLAKNIGGQTFLMGVSKRYPITTIDPTLVWADPRLAGDAVATDDFRRFMKNADFDGDSIVAHILRSRESAQEAFKTLTDPSSNTYKRYKEFARVADIFGGIEEDIMGRGLDLENVKSMYSTFSTRLTRFAPLVKQDVAERMGKMWTMHIGRYSNLSKILSFMTDIPTMQDSERAMRSMVGRVLQQMAIDFGRAAQQMGPKDPTIIAQQIGQAWQLAQQSSASGRGGANELMRTIFRDLGLYENLPKTLEKNRATKADTDLLNRILDNFFSTVNQEGRLTDIPIEELRRRGQLMDSLLKRGLRKEKLSLALSEFIEDQRSRAFGGEARWLNAPGRMPSASEAISGANTYIKQAATAAGHILEDVWQRFRGSPEAQAAGAILAGAGIVAAGIGFMSSPSKMEPPDYPSTAGRAIMRSPDVALAGSGGEAPIPGSRGGYVASRQGPEITPRYKRGVFGKSKRFYYDQSNRTPRITSYNATTPEEASFYASEYNDELQRNAYGNNRTSVNVINSPSARRYSKAEMRSRARDDLYG